MSNISLSATITIIDDTKEKIGQLRYHIIDSEAEIFDIYLFPYYRRQKIMSNLLKKMTNEFKVSGVKKIKLRYLDDIAHMAWRSMGFIQVDKNGNMELYLN